MAPVAVLIVSPGGRPLAVYVRTSRSASVATTFRVGEVFSAFVRSPIELMTGCRFTLLTVHVNVRVAINERSEAAAVTVCVPALANVNVPEMRPVDGLTLRPGGSPVTL